MNRYLLELREVDGEVSSEILYYYDDGAGPVGLDGLPLSEGVIIAVAGREWRVEAAEPARNLIRIRCVAVSPLRTERSSAQVAKSREGQVSDVVDVATLSARPSLGT